MKNLILSSLLFVSVSAFAENFCGKVIKVETKDEGKALLVYVAPDSRGEIFSIAPASNQLSILLSSLNNAKLKVCLHGADLDGKGTVESPASFKDLTLEY